MTYEAFLALAQARRSVRKFADRPVSKADLERLLEAARWGPSNHNRQPWKFIVLQDPATIRALAETLRSRLLEKLELLPPVAGTYARDYVHYATFFSHAPAVLVALHKRPVRFAQALLEEIEQPDLVSGEPLSLAMATQNLLLAAHTLALGTCVMTAPLVVPHVFFEILKLPPGFAITLLVALGYPAETPDPPRRKSIEKIAEFREAAGT